MPMPLMGTTAPASLIGNCVVTMAEILSTVVLLQLAAPGCALIARPRAGRRRHAQRQYVCGAPEADPGEPRQPRDVPLLRPADPGRRPGRRRPLPRLSGGRRRPVAALLGGAGRGRFAGRLRHARRRPELQPGRRRARQRRDGRRAASPRPSTRSTRADRARSTTSSRWVPAATSVPPVRHRGRGWRPRREAVEASRSPTRAPGRRPGR